MEKPLPNLDDLKEETFFDLIMSEEEIKERKIPREDLFQIKADGKIQGPIYKQRLLDYLNINQIDDIEVKALTSNDWLLATAHPLFQRRKPGLLSSVSLEDFHSVIYTLKNGEKAGPFSATEILEKFEKKELQVTDMISDDGIKNWKKLYEIQEFDRRDYQQLPHLPKNEVFTLTPPAIEEDYQQAEIEAIVGLAYVSNIKSGMRESTYEAAGQKAAEAKDQLPNLSKPKERKSYLKPLLIFSSVISLIAFYIFISNMPSSHGPQVTKQKAAVSNIRRNGPTVHKLKPRPRRAAQASVTEQAAPTIKPTRPRITRRKVNSFKESPAYKKYKKEQATATIEQEEEVRDDVEVEELGTDSPQDEVNLDEEMDDITDEEVDEFVKSIHGGFSIRSPASEDIEEEFEQEELE